MDWKAAIRNWNGRLGPSTFLKAGLVLTVIGAGLSLISTLDAAAAPLNLLSLILIYPWIAIWVKRLHDAGKPGWVFIPIMIAWIAVSSTASMAVSALFAPADMLAGAEPFGASMMDSMTRTARAAALPTTIAGAVISAAFVYFANVLLKSDPGPNAYGPPPPP